MYIQTLFGYAKNPKDTQKRFISHFSQPYASTSELGRAVFYPIDAFFEESIPGLVLTAFLVGRTCYHMATTLGYLCMLRGKDAFQEATHSLNALLTAACTLTLAFVAPILEAIRFFTRWGATVADHFAPKNQEDKEVRITTHGREISVTGNCDFEVTIHENEEACAVRL